MPKSVALLIPTLNEAEGIKAILPRIQKGWYDQILVVDGQSTDGTADYARSHGCEVVIQQVKGIRHAYTEAFKHIRSDIVVTLSPDGNCIPELIPSLVEKIREGYDMVVCSRYAKGAKSYDDSLLTGFGNWTFTHLINALHGGKYTDAMGIYRAYRTGLFYELGLDKDDPYAPEKFFGTVSGVEPLLSIRAAKKKMKIAEIPGDEPPRMAGERKLQVFRWGAAYLCQVLRETYHWR